MIRYLLILLFAAGTVIMNGQWKKIDSLPEDLYAAVLVKDGYIFAGGTDYLYRSNNGGDSWITLTNGLPQTPVTEDIIEFNGTIYIATFGKGVYKSTNNGESWSPMNQGLSELAMYGIKLFFDGTYLWLGTGGDMVYRSSAPYTSWQQKSNGILWRVSGDAFDFVKDGDTLYVGTGGNGVIYRSSNNGENWTELELFSAGMQIRTLLKENGSLIAGYQYGVMKKKPGGEWIRYFNGINLQDAAMFMRIIPYNGYLFSANTKSLSPRGRFYYSTDLGENWTEMSEGFADNEVMMDMHLHDKTLYGMTVSGIWKRNIEEITGIDEPQPVRQVDFEMAAAYPNPFNPSTTVELSLKEPASLKMEVFNIIGQTVISENARNFQAGISRIPLNLSGNNSGFYFVRFSGVTETSGRKINLMQKLVLNK